MRTSARAFTLIELLIVIAIIAIASVVVVLVLNPAELLRQSRDATRIADMGTFKEALGLYQADQPGSSLGNGLLTYVSLSDTTATSTRGDQCQGISGMPSGTYQCGAPLYYKDIDSTGWVPVALTMITAGSPISALPVDPVNATTSGLFFTYNASSNSYEFTTGLESQKYGAGSSSVLLTDGGSYSDRYEVGTNLTLLPVDPSASGGSSSSLAISGVGTSNVGTTTAQIDWTTNIAADSLVNYGPTTAYGSSTYVATAVTSHAVNLTGLTASTTYHYEVQSQSGALVATSSDGTFTTMPPFATITFDTSSSIAFSGVTTATATVTVGSGSNELFVIEVGSGTPVPTGVSVDGVSATQAMSVSTTSRGMSIWYATGLSPGIHIVSSTFTGVHSGGIQFSSYFGVSQSSPVDATAASTQNAAAVSSTVTTSVANDLIVDGMIYTSTVTLNSLINANQVLMSNGVGTIAFVDASYLFTTTPQAYTTGYNLSTTRIASMGQVAFEPAAQ